MFVCVCLVSCWLLAFLSPLCLDMVACVLVCSRCCFCFFFFLSFSLLLYAWRLNGICPLSGSVQLCRFMHACLCVLSCPYCLLVSLLCIRLLVALMLVSFVCYFSCRCYHGSCVLVACLSLVFCLCLCSCVCLLVLVCACLCMCLSCLVLAACLLLCFWIYLWLVCLSSLFAVASLLPASVAAVSLCFVSLCSCVVCVVCVYVCLSVCLSVCVCVSSFVLVCLYMSVFVCLVCLVSLCVCVWVCVSLGVYQCLSVSLCVSLCFTLSVSVVVSCCCLFPAWCFGLDAYPVFHCIGCYVPDPHQTCKCGMKLDTAFLFAFLGQKLQGCLEQEVSKVLSVVDQATSNFVNVFGFWPQSCSVDS